LREEAREEGGGRQEGGREGQKVGGGGRREGKGREKKIIKAHKYSSKRQIIILGNTVLGNID